jgi:hypothetical protein
MPSKKKSAMYKVASPWIDKVRMVKGRPALARLSATGAMSQTARLTEMLKATLKEGSARINEADLPINIKSLRTQVVQIAGKLAATSHVIVGSDRVISIWLEPRGSGKRRGRKPGPQAVAEQEPQAEAVAASA